MLWLIHAPAVPGRVDGRLRRDSLVVQFITRYWKISTHALGITAPLVALTILYGPQPLPFLVLIPIVCWARVYLKAHTLLQVVAGAARARARRCCSSRSSACYKVPALRRNPSPRFALGARRLGLRRRA